MTSPCPRCHGSGRFEKPERGAPGKVFDAHGEAELRRLRALGWSAERIWKEGGLECTVRAFVDEDGGKPRATGKPGRWIDRAAVPGLGVIRRRIAALGLG